MRKRVSKLLISDRCRYHATAGAPIAPLTLFDTVQRPLIVFLMLV